MVSTGTRSRVLPSEGCAEFRPGLPATVQSRHADWSMSTNAWPSGLREPSTPTFSGSTTGCSQPSDVKCDMPSNAFDGVEEAVDVEVVEEEDCATLVEGVVEEKVAAVVPFVVKSAARVSSAWETKFVLPVRTARR